MVSREIKVYFDTGSILNRQHIYKTAMSNRDLDELRNCFNRLKIKENVPTALNEIKSILAYKPAAEAAPTIRNIGISKILYCINTSTK